MSQLQRQDDIVKLLREFGEMTVQQMCDALYASPATIRRDLIELENKGMLKRSFGYARIKEDYSDPIPLTIRSKEHVPEKIKICEKAAKLIQPNELIFIDGSSTTYFLSKFLPDIPNVTVITNNPHLNIALSQRQVKSFSTGGEMLNSSALLIGNDAIKFIEGFHAHSCFFSSRGIKDDEITDSSQPERDIKLAMLRHSRKHYFLCDSSKYGVQYGYRVTDLTDIDEVIDEKD